MSGRLLGGRKSVLVIVAHDGESVLTKLGANKRSERTSSGGDPRSTSSRDDSTPPVFVKIFTVLTDRTP